VTEHKAAMTATICQTEMSGQESRIKSESSGKAPKGVSVQGNGYSVMLLLLLLLLGMCL
jgi:hypothetical protein